MDDKTQIIITTSNTSQPGVTYAQGAQVSQDDFGNLVDYIPLAIRPGYLNLVAARASVLPPRSKRTGLEVIGNVGIVSIKGPLEKESSFFSWLFGESTYEDIQEQLRHALALEEVTKILLKVSSPGGTVFGLDETVALIRAVAAKKPVIAYGSGDVCSAAYALVSPARKIIVSESTEVGSIGVVMTHIDRSQLDKELGIKVTEITAGEFKRAGSAHRPLDNKALSYLQGIVDRHMSIFKGWVQAGRALTDEQLADVANGKIFVGNDAVELGLIDKIDNYDNVLASLLDEEQNKDESKTFIGGPFMANEKVTITMEQLLEHAPQLIEQLRKEGAASVNVAEAVAAERNRIKAILEACPVGLEKEAKEMCFDSPVAEGQAAITLLKLAKEKGANLLASHREDAPAVLPAAPTESAGTEEEDYSILDGAVAEQNKKIAQKYGMQFQFAAPKQERGN